MCFLKEKAENPRTGGRRKRRLAAFLFACVLGLTGCGVSDFYEQITESDADGVIDRIAEPEDAAEKAPETGQDPDGEVSQEYARIEENRVEEGSSHLSKSDLEKRREEIGLSEADLVGLQEAQFGNYYFEQLNSEERILYVECYQILALQGEEILLSTTDVELLPRVYQCVINDHPEFFYLNGYTYTQYTRKEEVQYITF